MAISRRSVIKLIGGGAVAAATAGGGFIITRRPDAALAPWETAGRYDDPRTAALSWAILAPNPHNRQPWMAQLIDSDQIAIWRDKTVNLPETDPFDRQLTIGMGCFLEIFRQAAAEQGFTARFNFFPEGENGPVAAGRLVRGGGRNDPLFAQVLKRHTNRQSYENRLPPPEALAALSDETSELITDPAEVAALRQLTWQAMWIEMNTPRTHRESVRLMRFGKQEIEANPDGISLSGAKLEVLMALGLLTRDGQADRTSAEYRQTLEILRTAMNATPAYAVVKTKGNSRRDQIEAGRRWVRLHLAATAQGLSMQPVSQALQEYPEQAALHSTLHARLARPGETVQMLGRLGYGPAIGPSPRWPVESRIANV